jgi:hypothetical protein
MTTKIPAELSSTPSIVDNGDATAITIDSVSENVGFSITPESHYSDYTNLDFGKTGSNLVVKASSGHSGYYELYLEQRIFKFKLFQLWK